MTKFDSAPAGEYLRHLSQTLESLRFAANFNNSLRGVTLPSDLRQLTFGICFTQSVKGVTLPSRACSDSQPWTIVFEWCITEPFLMQKRSMSVNNYIPSGKQTWRLKSDPFTIIDTWFLYKQMVTFKFSMFDYQMVLTRPGCWHSPQWGNGFEANGSNHSAFGLEEKAWRCRMVGHQVLLQIISNQILSYSVNDVLYILSWLSCQCISPNLV